MDKHFNARFTTILLMIVAAAVSRLLPHPPNFTPIGALALFGGAYIDDKRLAFVVPLGALLLSDTIIGFHLLMPVVYACFAFMVWIGFTLRKGFGIGRLAVRVLASSLLFFTVTNAAVWAFGNMYPHTPAGLITCYVAAIPFFHNTMLGDIAYAAILFGSFALAERMIPSLKEKTAGW